MTAFKRLKILIAVLSVCAALFSARAAYAQEALVFDFETEKAFAEDWAAPALTDYAIRVLNSESTYSAMPRERLKRLVSRWPNSRKNSLSFEASDAIRQHIGAKFIIEGSLRRDRSGFQFTGSLVNPESGAARDLSFQQKNFDLAAIRKQLRLNIKKAIGLKFTANPAALLGTVNADAYQSYWKGVQRYESGDADNALVLFERAAERDPSYIEPTLMMGRILLDKAFFSKAAEQFKRATDKWPADARGHFLLGLTYYLQRQSAPARTALSKAAELDPDNPEILYQLGLLDKDSFRYADAVDELEKAVKQDSSLTDAWYQLASMHSNAKQEAKTLDCLEKAAAWGGREVIAKIRNDNDFSWLRGERRFQMIVNK
ncbi:MAG: tetratricopeptide repeat protein [bacterium]